MTKFEVRDRVRWADVDVSGTIYFGAYIRFVEAAETEFYRGLGFPFRRLEELGVQLARVHVAFDFFKPALLDDELTLCISVSNLGPHSVHTRVVVKRASDDALLAEATLVSAAIDEFRKSVALPEELAGALRAHLTKE